MVFGDAVSTGWMLFSGFAIIFQVRGLVSVYSEGFGLGQVTALGVVFQVAVSDCRLVGLLDPPQFPAQFRNGPYINNSISKETVLNKKDITT